MTDYPEIQADGLVIDINAELQALTAHWQPKIINSYGFQFRIVKFTGEFEWHTHEGSDKVMFVLAGEMLLEFRDGRDAVVVRAGEMYVVPQGCEQKPSATTECSIVLIEPKIA
ncbi:MAG: cupin domain-containing protein [Neisseriaceae bacterium]|nr:cupin domain-containing protein [Neisseriaceae bacterium]